MIYEMLIKNETDTEELFSLLQFSIGLIEMKLLRWGKLGEKPSQFQWIVFCVMHLKHIT